MENVNVKQQQQTGIVEQAKAYAVRVWQWAQAQNAARRSRAAAMRAATGNQVVRIYRGQRALEAGIAAMARQGYSVATQTSYQPRVGLLRFLTLGFFSLIWRPKPKFVVTFKRG